MHDKRDFGRMTTFDPSKDFDEWQALAKSDPQEFEARRTQVIEDFIQSAPDDLQRRLRGLQFRVDMERRRAANPLSACMRISDMMWDAVLREGGLRDALHGRINTDGGTPAEGPCGRRVVLFKRREVEEEV